MVKNNFTPLKDKSKKKWGFPSSTKSKEVEPTVTCEQVPERIVYHEAHEYIPDKETAGYIDKRHETMEIEEDLKRIGVIPVETTKYPEYERVQLPITDEEVVEGLKQPLTSSFRWLAEFAIRLLKQTHNTLKRIHGKIIRVATG